jgi:hypothetical protein
MEILDLGQQFSLPVFEPLRVGERLALGTMAIATRVVGDPLMSARVALLDMTADGTVNTARALALHQRSAGERPTVTFREVRTKK